MAQTIPCDGPDSTPALIMITKTDDGETSSFCEECFTDFCQAWLQAVDPGRLAPPPPQRKRGSSSKTAAAVADDSKGGEGGAAGSPE